MTSPQTRKAIDILDAIRTGTLPRDRFTAGATLWSNLGATMTIDEYITLIHTLHPLTRDGIALRVVSTMEDGHRIAIEANSWAELKNGKVYDNRYAFFFRFEGDLIAEIREHADTLHASQIFDISTIID